MSDTAAPTTGATDEQITEAVRRFHQHRGSLEQRVAAIESFIVMLDQQDHLLLNADEQIGILTSNLTDTIEQLADRLSALESAAREPERAAPPDDPLCANPACGHERSRHEPATTEADDLDELCECSHPRELHRFFGDDCCVPSCRCNKFTPATPPATEVDPVLWHIAEAARRAGGTTRLYLEAAYRLWMDLPSGSPVTDEMLAYGLPT